MLVTRFPVVYRVIASTVVAFVAVMLLCEIASSVSRAPADTAPP